MNMGIQTMFILQNIFVHEYYKQLFAHKLVNICFRLKFYVFNDKYYITVIFRIVIFKNKC